MEELCQSEKMVEKCHPIRSSRLGGARGREGVGVNARGIVIFPGASEIILELRKLQGSKVTWWWGVWLRGFVTA